MDKTIFLIIGSGPEGPGSVKKVTFNREGPEGGSLTCEDCTLDEAMADSIDLADVLQATENLSPNSDWPTGACVCVRLG